MACPSRPSSRSCSTVGLIRCAAGFRPCSELLVSCFQHLLSLVSEFPSARMSSQTHLGWVFNLETLAIERFVIAYLSHYSL